VYCWSTSTGCTRSEPLGGWPGVAGDEVADGYQNFLVAGLLQTEEYAREILRAGNRADQLDELVAIRMERQDILRRDDPPWLIVLLDESVVRRVVGNRDVMRRQLEHLLAVMNQPNVTLRIVPTAGGIYPVGAFNLLTFREETTVAYVEGVHGHGQLIDRGRQVCDLEVLFDQIGAVALPVAQSEKLIKVALEHL
jgi:uncharacterized protein DUF5753